MRAVVQRSGAARVEVDGRVVGAIDSGLVVLLGVTHDDADADARWMAAKVAELRVFADDDGKMNRSLLETRGGALVVSQFTLYGDARKGRRPSFVRAAQGDDARALYERVVGELAARGVEVATGEFGAMMDVTLVNRGPVTILLDSRKEF
ncbi:MAG TPA: D-aminoacyl-tRNA deacylase [Actinomycetota bacterium]|nr:D-aminoacyl-tRNA deacylase [Actinomycetota bacterium]